MSDTEAESESNEIKRRTIEYQSTRERERERFLLTLLVLGVYLINALLVFILLKGKRSSMRIPLLAIINRPESLPDACTKYEAR